MVTRNGIIQFEAFGFVALRGLLRPDELEIGLAAADRATERRGIRGQLNWSNLGLETPYLASLLEDPRFCDAAEQILGDDAVGYYCNANSFSRDRTEWHPDTTDIQWHGIKFGFYLQPLDADTGALWFILGSHKEPLHSDTKKIALKDANIEEGDEVGFSVEDVPAYVAVSEPGDVIIFDNHTWHGSWGGGVGRRMCTLGYFGSPTTPEEEASVKAHVEIEAGITRTFPLLERSPHWVSRSDGSPKHQRWIDSLRKWGFIQPA